jgi:hypothetical protein
MDNTAIKHVKDAAGERSDGMYMLKIIVVRKVLRETSGLDWARHSSAVELILDSSERCSQMPNQRLYTNAEGGGMNIIRYQVHSAIL